MIVKIWWRARAKHTAAAVFQTLAKLKAAKISAFDHHDHHHHQLNRVLLPPSQAKSLEATHERGFAGLQTKGGAGGRGALHSKRGGGGFFGGWVGGVMECKSQQQTSQPLKCRFLPSGNIQDCTEAIFPHKDYTMRRWQPRSRSAKAEMQ